MSSPRKDAPAEDLRGRPCSTISPAYMAIVRAMEAAAQVMGDQDKRHLPLLLDLQEEIEHLRLIVTSRAVVGSSATRIDGDAERPWRSPPAAACPRKLAGIGGEATGGIGDAHAVQEFRGVLILRLSHTEEVRCSRRSDSRW